MKVARIALLQKIEKGYLPDGFSVSISGNDSNTKLIYSESFTTQEDIFNLTVETTKKLFDSGIISSEYKDGIGTITLTDHGERHEILERLMRELLVQLGFYFNDDEIKEMIDYVKVYEVWEEK